jgi:citrate synthase
VTASTLADPYTVVASSIGALKGPLHGGANEEVVAMLRAIGTVDRVRPYLEAKLKAKEPIMGFGHRVYKVKDPRAIILQQLAQKLFAHCGKSPLYELAEAVERVGLELLAPKRVFPNTFTPLFAMARVAGWLAHWLEQLQENKLYRPDQIYEGEHGRRYLPLDERE